MAIDKKLIHFKTKENFMSANGVNGNPNTPTSGSEETGNAEYGQIKGTSIVFIQDSQQIWTHGQLYNCSEMVPITYGELKLLRDNGVLIPGMQYRITDYVTTTSQTDTQSAQHLFDIIVTADSENTINEKARAIQHEGDTYFADSNLSAWELWYCLDNDTNRFTWADTTNGKGVIYRMIDESNNDCPYDFKNIQFIRYELNAPDEYIAGRPYELFAELLSENVRDMFRQNIRSYVWSGTDSENRDWANWGIISSPTGVTKAFYTFSTNDDEDASWLKYCRNNKIAFSDRLPNNVFFGIGCEYNTLGNSCENNSFGGSCYNNSFGTQCYSNIFSGSCHYNIFGSDCSYNIFGSLCDYNSFGNSCSYNSLFVGCEYNTLGNSCENNSFGSSCYNNSFGNSCSYNGLSGVCTQNSFGNMCSCNRFGSSCELNIFDNLCQYNMLGNNCNQNSFGVHGYAILFGSTTELFGHYYYKNSFDPGVSNISCMNDATASYNQQVQNYHFTSGLSDATIEVERNRAYQTTVAKNSVGDVKQFCIADIIK